jgi:hypothetical protein
MGHEEARPDGRVPTTLGRRLQLRRQGLPDKVRSLLPSLPFSPSPLNSA